MTCIVHFNSFNTRPPGPEGSWQPADVRTPPGRGVTLSFCFGIFNDKILEFVASIHQITILDILSRNRITYALRAVHTRRRPHVCFRRFSVRDISCEQNVKVEVKLIYFLIGFVLGLDFSCLDIGLA